jgi:hypothetical protein
MKCLSTAPLDGWKKYAGFLSMKVMNNTPWLSFPSVKDTQDTLT